MSRARSRQRTGSRPLSQTTTAKRINCIIINPFHGGSHKSFVDVLIRHFDEQPSSSSTPSIALFTLPGKKWHWRLLVSAAHFANTIPLEEPISSINNHISYNDHCHNSNGDDNGVLFTTSLLNLADLVALRPDLGRRHKILYFHENQFFYPNSAQNSNRNSTTVTSNHHNHHNHHNNKKKKWSEYGWAQIMSCLVADRILFNSQHNLATFLDGARRFLSQIPAPSRPTNVVQRIETKCSVLYYPIERSKFVNQRGSAGMNTNTSISDDDADDADDATLVVPPLHVVWPHRWEHDKGPEILLQLLRRLNQGTTPITVSIVGVRYPEAPSTFQEIGAEFWNNGNPSSRGGSVHLTHFGGLDDKDEYLALLDSADIVLSTALHEFFGVAVMEGVVAGCVPLCPERLSYPELYPKECLYRTDNQMYKALHNYAQRPDIFRRHTSRQILKKINVARFTMSTLGPKYQELLLFGTKITKSNAQQYVSTTVYKIAALVLLVATLLMLFKFDKLSEILSKITH